MLGHDNLKGSIDLTNLRNNIIRPSTHAAGEVDLYKVRLVCHRRLIVGLTIAELDLKGRRDWNRRSMKIRGLIRAALVPLALEMFLISPQRTARNRSLY